jgi:hypothetical protein
MKSVTWKFPPRRKAEEFSIYKPDSQGLIVFQSDKSIGIVDPITGKGKLYLGKSGGAYFAHLMFGTPVKFPEEFVSLLVADAPKSGDLIGVSPVCGEVRWA